MSEIICGDALSVLENLPDGIVDCCVTSPPYYGLRDYGVDGQIGLEEIPEQYIQRLVEVFREVRRVLKDDGTLWVNIGDSYAAQRGGTYQPAETLSGGAHGKTSNGENVNRGRRDGYNPTRNAAAIGLKHKDLIGIPWMLAFALRADGWYLRQDIIWHKPNPMPESVKDRCTKSHEYIFLLSKSERYHYDSDAISEPAKQTDQGHPIGGTRRNKIGDTHFRTASGNEYTPRYKNLADKGLAPHSMHKRRAEGEKDIVYPYRNKRDVWSVNTKPNKAAHFATFPEELIEPCILAGSRVGGIVLDPFFGSGTTGAVALKHGREYLGIELNPEYIKIAENRLESVQPKLLGIM